MIRILVTIMLVMGFVLTPRVGRGQSSADMNQDHRISLEELLRVIQLYNSPEYHCDLTTEDGYALDSGDQTCSAHTSDYNPENWRIGLSELLRLVQFYQVGGYHEEPGSEDGLAPGLPVLWKREFPLTQSSMPNSFGSAVARHPDGGFLIAGYAKETFCLSAEGETGKLAGAPCEDTMGALLLHLDENGIEQWHHVYSLGTDTCATTLHVNSSNNEIFIAGSNRESAGQPFTGFVIKTDFFGNIIWDRRFYEGDACEIFALAKTADDAYIAAGYSETNSLRDAWLVKISQDGNEVWSRVYSSPCCTPDTPNFVCSEAFYDVQIVPGEGFVTAGELLQQIGPAIWKTLIAKMGENGELVWLRQNEWMGTARRVRVLPNGGYLVLGAPQDRFSTGLLLLSGTGDTLKQIMYSDQLLDITVLQNGTFLGVGWGHPEPLQTRQVEALTMKFDKSLEIIERNPYFGPKTERIDTVLTLGQDEYLLVGRAETIPGDDWTQYQSTVLVIRTL